MTHEPILFTGVERQELDDFTVQLAQLSSGDVEWLRRHHSLQPPDEVISYIAAHWQELASLIATRLLERRPDASDADQHRTFVRKTAFWRRKLALIEAELDRRRQLAVRAVAIPIEAREAPPPAVEPPEAPPSSVEPPELPTPDAERVDVAQPSAEPQPAPRPARRQRHWGRAAPSHADQGRQAGPSEDASQGNGSKSTDSAPVDELSTVAAAQPTHDPEGD